MKYLRTKATSLWIAMHAALARAWRAFCRGAWLTLTFSLKDWLYIQGYVEKASVDNITVSEERYSRVIFDNPRR